MLSMAGIGQTCLMCCGPAQTALTRCLCIYVPAGSLHMYGKLSG